MPRPKRRKPPSSLGRLAAVAFGGSLGAAAYMLYESQWLEPREEVLCLEGLPPALEGLGLLHLSDAHIGQWGLNLRSFRKAVDWAVCRRPDLVLLTGDMTGTRRGHSGFFGQLGRLHPRLGLYAVLGNHEYGLSKNPFARAAEPPAWESTGVTLLRDRCVNLELGEGSDTVTLRLCGADYLTGGHGMNIDPVDPAFAVLLIHRPPLPDDPLAHRFDLTFAGHTHGGQIRIPTPWGLRRLHDEDLPYVAGIHRWGTGRLAISRGTGTTFLPFRLFTRPEVVLYRLSGAPAPPLNL